MLICIYIDSNEVDYLLSEKKFGFLPDSLHHKCREQSWQVLYIKSGIKEGKGVFSNAFIRKNTALCNYGGVQVSNSFAKKHLLPFDEKCDYLVELYEKTSDGMKKFYINFDIKENKTLGQLLNHSSLHPNAVPKVFVTGTNQLDTISYLSCNIEPDEEILWDYGKHFSGVEPCMASCLKCKCAKCK